MKRIFKIIIFLGIVILIIIWIFVGKAKENELLKSMEGRMVYFYGETCPHCANVERFFKEKNIENKIQFEKKEVYNDRENAKLLVLLAKKKCNLKENEIGVPFFWDGVKCIVGDQPIIDYFEKNLLTKHE